MSTDVNLLHNKQTIRDAEARLVRRQLSLLNPLILPEPPAPHSYRYPGIGGETPVS
jgi:hypothetical protein